MRRVSNPLTVIAIFAALAEVNSTVAISLITPELQQTFVWFIIVFPILLVALFFATLNFNPQVIYAPSDFQDEQNFVQTMSGSIFLNKQSAQISVNEFNLQSVDQQVAKVSEDLSKSDTASDKLSQKRLQQLSITSAKKLEALFEKKLVGSFGISLKSPTYFLLHIQFNSKIFDFSRINGRHDFIIKFPNGSNDAGRISMFDGTVEFTNQNLDDLLDQFIEWAIKRAESFPRLEAE